MDFSSDSASPWMETQVQAVASPSRFFLGRCPEVCEWGPHRVVAWQGEFALEAGPGQGVQPTDATATCPAMHI